MTWLQTVWNFLVSHQTAIKSAFVVFVLALLNHNVGSEQVKTWLHVILDVVSPGTQGGGEARLAFTNKTFRSGGLKVPFLMMSAKPMRIPLPLPPMSTFLPFLLLLSSCQCWTPAHVNDPGCVILHDVIDCTVGLTKDTAPAVAAIIENYIEGNVSPNWTFVESQLELLGLKDGGCILADLMNQYLAKPQGAPVKARAIADLLSLWKNKHQIPGVKYKVELHGKVSLL